MKATTIEKRPKISIVVAIRKQDNAIGRDTGELLFRISDDLKRFKSLTTGHPIIMGRKTYESIGKPLPERTNIVVTHNLDFKAEGCLVVSSLEEAIERGRETSTEEIFVIGGGEIYRQALPYTDKLYLTIVDGGAEGNVFFPEWRKHFKKEISREERVDEKTGLGYVWTTLEREAI
ncbi:MAG: dihydrofolate reductase [Candidatus Zambryskibacteria bacterium]|nr:dihydrofolate reductase [Candidatus Zambryskibacteria bacterium]